MRQTFEIEYEDFKSLTVTTRETMMRNGVECSHSFREDDMEWCRNNCTDLWVYTDADIIRFASKEDLERFLART